MDPLPGGPDWMKISPVAGSLFHEKEQRGRNWLRWSFRQSQLAALAASTPVVRHTARPSDARRGGSVVAGAARRLSLSGDGAQRAGGLP